MAAGVQIRGAPAFIASMSAAARTMADLPGFTDAGEVIAAAASDEAPRLTGALAGSLQVIKEEKGSATVTSPLVYAVPIHWGRPAHNIAANPFITRAAEQTESRWVDALEHSAQSTLDKVRGI